MKINSITITKGIVILMGLAVLSICAILIPELGREEAAGKANPAPFWPFLIAAWVLATPIFIALLQTFKLLSFIDKNKAFSKEAVRTLRNIKYCSAVFAVLIFSGAVTLIASAKINSPEEDMPPIFMLGTIITFTASVIATFSAVLERLLKEAISIKSENDLIV